MIDIKVGDACGVLKELPDESVHCVVTSPPYWGLRAYKGDPGMIGLEPTLDEHFANLVAVFREVRRVMRPDATLWLNYGDSYAAQGTGTQGANGQMASRTVSKHRGGAGRPHGDVKPKDLMLMPARVALALQSDGWWVRSEIVWHKPNPMPESVTDRPTSAHEKVFLLSKSARYFYDAEAVRVPQSQGTLDRFGSGRAPRKQAPKTGDMKSGNAFPEALMQDGGANLRNVWSIPTHGYSEAHLATFPPALVEPCIKAGTSEKGACAECGAPWVRVVEKTLGFHPAAPKQPTPARDVPETGSRGDNMQRDGFHNGGRSNVTTTGWSPSCECDAGVVPCVVLDPFGGAGTVGLVADRLQRDAVLIEISPEYADMARKRIDGDAPLFSGAALPEAAPIADKQAGHGRRHTGFNERWAASAAE